MRKEAKFGGSIEGEKNPSVFNPPPYKNNQEYKGGTNDETRDFHTRETSVSQSDDVSCAKNWMQKIKVQNMIDTLTLRQ